MLQNTSFIAPNPSTPTNPQSTTPSIHPSAYIGPFSAIIGDVTINNNVFVGPNVSIRADEGSPFYIDSNTNIQDGVILHGLENLFITHDEKQYSIYIGKHVSCAHGCIIHGPCKIGDGSFISFRAVILNASIGKNCYISPNSYITGVALKDNRFVPPGMIIDSQEKADALEETAEPHHNFAKTVQRVNNGLTLSYNAFFKH